MFKKENGITLVALVITIIVLLILAGVSISMISGDDGIATRASDAKTKTDLGNVQDAVNLAISSMNTQYWADFADDATTEKPKTVGEVNTYLNKQGYKITTPATTTDLVNNLELDIAVNEEDATATHKAKITMSNDLITSAVVSAK